MTILIIDGHNFMFRSRSGFQLGDYNVCFNFFRSLKPLVEQFSPNRVIFTLEGHPKRRYELLPSYKANRHLKIELDASPEQVEKVEKKRKSDEDYRRQQGLIIDLLQSFPVSVMRHPDFEADDLIYNVIKNSARSTEFVVVSTDTDFIQLLQEFPNTRVYNPVKKSFFEAPTYDYVQWKALRGDGSDNVKGIVGIGDKGAEQLLEDPEALQTVLNEHGETFQRNCELIRFASWTDEETMQTESNVPGSDWDRVKQKFIDWEFKSMVKEPYWSKFVSVFGTLVP